MLVRGKIRVFAGGEPFLGPRAGILQGGDFVRAALRTLVPMLMILMMIATVMATVMAMLMAVMMVMMMVKMIMTKTEGQRAVCT
jgi:hypothetical protein